MSHPHTSVLYCHVNLHTCLFTTYLLLHLASHYISLVPLTTSYHLPLAASHCLCLSLPITAYHDLHLNKATLSLSVPRSLHLPAHLPQSKRNNPSITTLDPLREK